MTKPDPHARPLSVPEYLWLDGPDDCRPDEVDDLARRAERTRRALDAWIASQQEGAA